MPFTKHTFLFAILLMSIAYSCKDKTPEPNIACSSNPYGCNSVSVAKEFFLFKPGSYWVYEEEHSHMRDSMYVYSYANGSNYDFDIVIKSALDNFQYHYWPEYNGQPNDNQCSTTKPVAKKCMNIKRSKYIPGSPGVFVGEGRCMFFQYNLTDSVPSYSTNFESNFIHITAIMDAYELGDLDFSKTVKVYNRKDQQSNLHPTNHYYSKGVGLIRKELIDTPEVWNLVNYYIAP